MARLSLSLLTTALCASVVAARSADDEPQWKQGSVALQSVGALTFSPAGVLFVADPEGAAIFALEVGDAESQEDAPEIAFEHLGQMLADLLGTRPEEVRIHDLAVHPSSGLAYLSVTRGGGTSARPLLVRVGGPEELEVLELEKIRFLVVKLDNAPEPGGSGRRNLRAQSITDLEFHDGQLYVAGLSNEEFSSKLRTFAFPFGKDEAGSGVKIYHASHGRWETRSPVRAFIPMVIGEEPHLICGYTCTPLVKFPISDLAPGENVVGTTIAELGNRNTPLDMIVYHEGDATFLLIANTSRGVMKVSTARIEEMAGISDPVGRGETAGLEYETIEGLADVTQLARFDEKRALVLVQPSGGGAALRTIELP